MSENKIQLTMTDKIEFSIDGRTYTTPILGNGEDPPYVDAIDVFNMLIVAARTRDDYHAHQALFLVQLQMEGIKDDGK